MGAYITVKAFEYTLYPMQYSGWGPKLCKVLLSAVVVSALCCVGPLSSPGPYAAPEIHVDVGSFSGT